LRVGQLRIDRLCLDKQVRFEAVFTKCGDSTVESACSFDRGETIGTCFSI